MHRDHSPRNSPLYSCLGFLFSQISLAPRKTAGQAGESQYGDFEQLQQVPGSGR